MDSALSIASDLLDLKQFSNFSYFQCNQWHKFWILPQSCGESIWCKGFNIQPGNYFGGFNSHQHQPVPFQVPSQLTASVSSRSAVSLRCEPEHKTRNSLETGLKNDWFKLKCWHQHSPNKSHTLNSFQSTSYEDAGKVQNAPELLSLPHAESTRLSILLARNYRVKI